MVQVFRNEPTNCCLKQKKKKNVYLCSVPDSNNSDSDNNDSDSATRYKWRMDSIFPPYHQPLVTQFLACHGYTPTIQILNIGDNGMSILV